MRMEGLETRQAGVQTDGGANWQESRDSGGGKVLANLSVCM